MPFQSLSEQKQRRYPRFSILKTVKFCKLRSISLLQKTTELIYQSLDKKTEDIFIVFKERGVFAWASLNGIMMSLEITSTTRVCRVHYSA